jgi:hypothetical protein
MEHNRYNLSISTTDAQSNSASVNTDDPSDVLRLMQLAGQGMSKRYNASITLGGDNMQDTTTMTVNTTAPDDVMRLLQLAGVQQSPASPCGCVGPCNCGSANLCGCEGPCQCQAGSDLDIPPEVVVMEQQAEYDFGHKEPNDETLTFDLKDYNFKGRADLPERLTNARFGSNALKSEMRESLHAKLVAAYKDFINESEQVVNADGRASPLTANNRDEFLKDPFTEEPDTDGSESPLSNIKRQHIHR